MIALTRFVALSIALSAIAINAAPIRRQNSGQGVLHACSTRRDAYTWVFFQALLSPLELGLVESAALIPTSSSVCPQLLSAPSREHAVDCSRWYIY